MTSLKAILAFLVIPTALCAIFPESTSNFTIHDPAAIYRKGNYYVFAGTNKGPGMPYYKTPNLYGNYIEVGQILPSGSIIKQPGENGTTPWAPAVVEKNGIFYVYYAVTTAGTQNSAIGVAQTANLDDAKSWIDHGAVFYTGQGPDYDVGAMSASNAIDATVFIDPQSKLPILQWGSFFGGIFQAPASRQYDSAARPKWAGKWQFALRIPTNQRKARTTPSGHKWAFGPHAIEGSAAVIQRWLVLRVVCTWGVLRARRCGERYPHSI